MALYTQADVDAMLVQLAAFRALLEANPEANPGWLESLEGREDAVQALLGTEKVIVPSEVLKQKLLLARQEVIDATASGDQVRWAKARLSMLELRLEREGVEE